MITEPIKEMRKKRSGMSQFLRVLGPGLITGAADDDPSGIATYSQAGAQFGFGMLWAAVYQLPLLIAIQEACARIGAVTGKGLARVIKENYTKKILFAVVMLVVIANTINIGADIGAIASAAELVVPVPFAVLAVGFSALIVFLEVFMSYKRYSKVLKWLALALLAYPITALVVHQPWGEILRATFLPHVELSFAFIFIVTGVFGTTISPYMFFWQASSEVEEEIQSRRLAESKGVPPRVSKLFLRNIRIDNAVGMIASNLGQWFIIVTTATVLFSNGITNIGSAADAAKALEPLVSGFPNAGQLAKALFATGAVGLGLLGVPVLAGSAAYAMAEAFGWKEGLYRKFSKARGFYGVIIASTTIGLLINFVGINPMKALVFTAVFNGIAAVPLVYLIARINGNSKILGEHTGGALSRGLVWLTFGVMAMSALALLYTTVG